MGLFNFLKIKKEHRYYLICHTCKTKHFVTGNMDTVLREFADFCNRHRYENGMPHDRDILPKVVAKTPLGELLLAYSPNATVKQALGTYTALTVTGLQSLANHATNGWKSAAVSNIATLALDYQLHIYLPMANTDPANEKAVYIYLYAGTYSGAAWYYTDKGTATANDGAEGTSTIASPFNMPLWKVLSYTTKQMILNSGGDYIARCFGGRIPDAWGVQIINFTGAALSTGCVVAYQAYTETVV